MTSCPTQAATLAAFSSTLQSGPVYRKCATMHARRCESAGVCHTTINGEHETSKPYEAGDYLEWYREAHLKHAILKRIAQEAYAAHHDGLIEQQSQTWNVTATSALKQTFSIR